jgi:regulation of enolase protein 1 (concanavalin A-like superfamily)
VDVHVGLLVWQDEWHFARLVMHHTGTERRRAAVALDGCVAGQFRGIGRGYCDRQPMWLRVERVGDELRGLCSADGEHWLGCGSMRMPQREEEVVGLAAHSVYPDDQAWFDTLLLWALGSDSS